MMKSRLLKSCASPPAIAPSDSSRSLWASRIRARRASVTSRTCTSAAAGRSRWPATGVAEISWMRTVLLEPMSSDSMRAGSPATAPRIALSIRSRSPAPSSNGIVSSTVRPTSVESGSAVVELAITTRESRSTRRTRPGAASIAAASSASRCSSERCTRKRELAACRKSSRPMSASSTSATSVRTCCTRGIPNPSAAEAETSTGRSPKLIASGAETATEPSLAGGPNSSDRGFWPGSAGVAWAREKWMLPESGPTVSIASAMFTGMEMATTRNSGSPGCFVACGETNTRLGTATPSEPGTLRMPSSRGAPTSPDLATSGASAALVPSTFARALVPPRRSISYFIT
ncbi:unannotated protein [freshwater metagenome]|uniref:Unannotated protein n=1 Tax=freshwater metagenome TaxID=449393 RepID=A0A6J7KIJ3_9ZZZZ